MSYPALRAATYLMSARGTLSILIFHRVLARHDDFNPDDIDATVFDRQIEFLSACYRVMRLDDAVDALVRGKLPPRAAVITFDDGYADNAEIALPILQRHGVSATFFVASGFLDGGMMWNDKIIESMRRGENRLVDLTHAGLGEVCLTPTWQSAFEVIKRLKYLAPQAREEAIAALIEAAGVLLPRNLMMTRAQVASLASNGMTIGAHTVNHPILASIDIEAAEREIADNRAELEMITGEPIRLFAYPNGKPGQDYRREHVDLVRRLGFKAAVSTAWGVAHRASDVFQLPRFTPWDTRPHRFGLRLLHNQTRRDYATV